MSHSDLNLDSLDTADDITKRQLVTKYDSIVTILIPTADPIQIDTLRKSLFGNAKHVDKDTIFSNVELFTNISDYGILKSDDYSMTSDLPYERCGITKYGTNYLSGKRLELIKIENQLSHSS